MKLIQVGFRKCMVKVEMDDKKAQWMDIVGNEQYKAEAVKILISTNYKPGDEIKLDYVQNGQDFQVKSVILANGQIPPAVNNTTATLTNTEFVQKTTGKVTPKPVQTYTPRNTGQSIELQNCGRNTAETIKALTGRVDENNVIELIDKIFAAYKRNIQG